MTTPSDNFTYLSPWVGTGPAAPSGWLPLADCSLLILVGLTGVGKSTTVEALTTSRPSLRLLPDRRSLTDQLLIPRVQAAAGETMRPISDRAERFAYTRRYRERWPGGMAHALSQLQLESTVASASQFLFDGLRGENEVRHAAELLPQARFIMLDAPHAVRVRRLLGRDDTFDRISPVEDRISPVEDRIRPVEDRISPVEDRISPVEDRISPVEDRISPVEDQPGPGATNLADLGLAEAADLFSPAQARSLLTLVQNGEISPADLQAKVQIVLAERRNYDPEATQAALRQQAPQRFLIIDTTRHSPAEVAQQIRRFHDATR